MADPQKPRRRWLQFRLRTFLVTLTVFAVVFAWVHQLHERHAARRRLEELAGTVEIEPAPAWVYSVAGNGWGVYFETMTALDFSPASGRFTARDYPDLHAGDENGSNFRVMYDVGRQTGLVRLNLASVYRLNDGHVAHVSRLTRLKELILDSTAVTDKGLQSLRGLTSLERLSLYATEITGQGIVNLGLLINLERLDLSQTAVDDEGLRHVAHLTSLQDLDLSETQVGDAGVAHLKQLVELKRLNLSLTQITDRALADIAFLPRLTELRLYNCPVNDEGIAKLAALSQLEILVLASTEVGNEGLLQLAGLAQLRELELRGSNVTRQGVRQFQKRHGKGVIIDGP